MVNKPVIYWIRRDFRLASNLVFLKSVHENIPLVPVFIRDKNYKNLGGCPKWRLFQGLKHFDSVLKNLGSKLIFRTGDSLEVLLDIAREINSNEIWWNRLYDPDNSVLEQRVISGLRIQGCAVRNFPGHLLFDPNEIRNMSGDYFKVYTPFWNNVRSRFVPSPNVAPTVIPKNTQWPRTEDSKNWENEFEGSYREFTLKKYVSIGETEAQNKLKQFIENSIKNYHELRNFPSKEGTSKLSQHLTYGEISPWDCWQAIKKYPFKSHMGVETFAKELVWREFGYYLAHYTPEILKKNWRGEWDSFPWSVDESVPEVIAWKQGRTGIKFVDAGMREMLTTGFMHNRSRMIVGSYLTKHLLVHWKVGLKWFEEHLVDWDPCSNALGWQWVSGAGPDAAPYFRIFNPDTQLFRFDEFNNYVNRWIDEGQSNPPEQFQDYQKVVSIIWDRLTAEPYPTSVVDLSLGRKRALEKYQIWKSRLRK